MSRALASILCLCALIACQRGPVSPEEQLRQVIFRAAQAAENRDLGALRGFVSGDYRDEQGYDREGVLALARATLVAHRAVQIITRIKTVEFVAPKQAVVSVVAGMAGRRMADDINLRGFDGDLFHFDLNFAEEAPDEWRVTSAGWRSTSLSDALQVP